MVIKTFNLDEQIYKEYSEYCKNEGISMSKRVEKFLREDLASLRTNSENMKKIGSLGEISPRLNHHSMKRYC